MSLFPLFGSLRFAPALLLTMLAGCGGNVVVSATPEGAFAGNVDVVMNTGDPLQFDFDATPSCPALTKPDNPGP